MLVDASTAVSLKPWLIRSLEPICDAEPGALADYVLALLNHDASEADLRKELNAQLDEFLEKECPQFVDTLFTALRTKSYLPYTADSSAGPSSSNRAAHDVYSHQRNTRGQKRGLDGDDREAYQPPPKGPRLSHGDHSFRHGDSGKREMDGSRNDRQIQRANVVEGPLGLGASNGYQPPPESRRGICRDYYHKGFCARGAFCKFSHGDDAVVPTQIMPMGGMPFMPMFSNGGLPFNGGAGPGYDPLEAHMDLRGSPLNYAAAGPSAVPSHTVHRPSRAPIAPRVKHNDGQDQVMHDPHAVGELAVIQDLTPGQMSSTVPQDISVLFPNGPHGSGHISIMDNTAFGAVDGTITSIQPSIPTNFRERGSRGGARGGRRGGPFTGEQPVFVSGERPQRRQEKTLVVEKLPEDKRSLDAVNSWFKQFGTITNVAIDAQGAKALVSFSTHEEAHIAWKSQDAVFGNRFVKVFWHRPVEGHGQTGSKLLAASAPMVATINKDSPIRVAPDGVAKSPGSATSSSRAPSALSALAALAAKQQLLEHQISEQKSLMTKLSGASSEEKTEIMARLRRLGEEMKSSAGAPSPPISVPGSSKVRSSPVTANGMEKKRELLDKELDLHTSSMDQDGADGGGSSEDLKAQLAKLKAEAASLGLSDSMEISGSTTGSPRPYRGRGRVRGARGYFRGSGRGGHLASFSLDNRPKKLRVQGVTEDQVQNVRDWYETTGAVDTLERMSNSDIVISFRTRSAAEQGLAKGRHIPLVGEVQITWHSGPSTGTIVSDTTAKAPVDQPGDRPTEKGAAEVQKVDDDHEEAAVGGWGDEDDRM